jgi:hypothetical protein
MNGMKVMNVMNGLRYSNEIAILSMVAPSVT